MSIEFTYEITSVDEAARCMVVKYASDGRETMVVGARLPFEGEALESVIRAYSPVSYWMAKETPVVLPAVGTTGQVVVVTEAPPANEDDTA